MLNAIFIILIAGSVVFAALTGNMSEVNDAWIEAAKTAVTIAIGLIGLMALWLGMMRVLRDAGLMSALARAIAPVMRRLFPDVPSDHPAMGAMLMNIAANMLGLGNAATPFGLKAMRELETLNPRPGVSTNAMSLFLALNTSGVAVLPLGVISVRASMGSENPGAILIPTILATICSTIVAVIVAKSLQDRARFSPDRELGEPQSEESGGTLADDIAGLSEAEEIAAIQTQSSRWRVALTVFAMLAVVAAAVYRVRWVGDTSFADLNNWLLPVLLAGIAMLGFSRRVTVYDSFIKGAREGFDIAVMIIPFLVAILVAVAMFRASGALEFLTAALGYVTNPVGFPAEALPMALIRPLSGSGALGVMTATMETYGPDSFVGLLVSVMNGSTETTFYVLALYFGSVRVRAARHTVWACLAADATGVIAALLWCRLFF